MEEKLNEILIRTEAIENRLEKPKSKIGKIFEVIEKLLIPLALLVLAYFTNTASIRISESQLELARSQERRQKTDAVESLQLKYVELFYQDVTGDSHQKQQAAIQLLRIMRPDLAEQMLRMIQGVPAFLTMIRDNSKVIDVPMKKSAGPLTISLQFGRTFTTYSINIVDGTRNLFGPFEGDNTNSEDDEFIVPIQEKEVKSPSVRVFVTLLAPTEEKQSYSVTITFRQSGVELASDEFKGDLVESAYSFAFLARIVTSD